MIIESQHAPAIDTVCVAGDRVDLAALRGKKVLVKFHRFSGCPIARRQIGELIESQSRLTAAGIETIVVLHSSREKVVPNFEEVPGLHLVADRDKHLYRAYGCAFSWAKLFSPGSWRSTVGAVLAGCRPQPSRFQGGVVGIPADFLIDEAGLVAAVHYGRHFGDSWTAADVLRAAGGSAGDVAAARSS